MVLLEGEAGVGKSRLVGSAVAAGIVAGFTVFDGRAEAITRDRPFGPLLDALGIGEPDADVARKSVAAMLAPGAVAERVPSLLAMTVPEAQIRVVDALAELVAGLAAQSPVMLVVEDLHWAEPSSTAMALRAIARRGEDLPIAIVVTLRPAVTDTVQSVRTVLRDAGAHEIVVPPLDRSASQALLAHCLDAFPGPGIARLAEGAAGNPLLLITLVEGLHREGRISRTGAVADVESDVLPRSLAGQVLRTLSTLSRDARGLLRLAAVLGSRFTAHDVVDASRLSTLELAEAIDEALVAGLLVEDGASLAFRHELVRDAIYRELSTAMRAAVHRELARSLADRGASASRVAAHFSLGAEEGDAEAVAWIRRAASEVIAASPAAAIDLLDRAVALAPGGTELRAEVLADRVEALGMAGRLEDAESAAADVVHQLRDPERVAAVSRLHALALLLRNRCAEAATELERLAGSSPDPVGCLAEAGLAALGAGDIADATRLGELALRGSRVDDGGRSLALTVLARVASLEGNLSSMLGRSEESLRVADRSVAPDSHRHLPLFFHAMALFDLDRFDDCDATVAAGQRFAEEQGVAFAAPLHHSLAAFSALRRGDVAACAVEAELGITACDETGKDVALVWSLALGALAAIHRDDLTTAGRLLERASSIAAVRPPWMGFDLLALAEARLAEAMTGAAAALDILLPGLEVLESIGVRTMSMTLAPDVVRLAVAAGRLDDARRVASLVADIGALADAIPAWRAAAVEAAALVSGAEVARREAVDAHRSSPRRLELARALEHHGTGESLGEAVQLYDAAGATRDRGRAVAALRALGLRPPRRPGDGGWSALSPAEVDVVRLVAEGLSNGEVGARLFISRRTVESHLRRVFTKLDVSSRVDLANWVASRAAGR
jgi:DNA-binding CsgD family transcriptional regulator/tetratricopeptide (TPR) repeat protein